MKKVLLILIILIVIIGVSMFVLLNKGHGQKYYDLKKVRPYLYEISFDDYRYDANLETLAGVEEFACSSVKNGNFYGRNFDFIFNDMPEFVIKVKAKEGRHASIGVGMLAKIKDSDDLESEYIEKLELLPNSMLDGINDCGVICSNNVVPKEDVLPVTGTNPKGEDLHMGLVVRYVLDNASSADEAIKLLKARNIYGDMGEHYNLHFMIADKNKTYVVEFIDNKLVAEEKKNDEQIMTNFYVNLDAPTENSVGVERYGILQEHYNEGKSFEGMWKLMQRVHYSKAYEDDNTWYSEFLTQSEIANLATEELDADTLEETEELVKNYWEARRTEKRDPANIMFWFTTHNSVYDIEERKLRLTVQENYDKYYEYSLEK